MSDRLQIVPSTAALRAFEAAARHLSFTGAAVELGRTQGAVSHQIRELESRLGVTLFARRGTFSSIFIASPVFFWWHKGDRHHVESHADIMPKYDWKAGSKSKS